MFSFTSRKLRSLKVKVIKEMFNSIVSLAVLDAAPLHSTLR